MLKRSAISSELNPRSISRPQNDQMKLDLLQLIETHSSDSSQHIAIMTRIVSLYTAPMTLHSNCMTCHVVMEDAEKHGTRL